MCDADFNKESVSGNAIRYNDVYRNVDIQYTVKNNGVKEDIILLDKTNRGSFTYSLSSDGIIRMMMLRTRRIIVLPVRPSSTHFKQLNPFFFAERL